MHRPSSPLYRKHAALSDHPMIEARKEYPAILTVAKRVDADGLFGCNQWRIDPLNGIEFLNRYQKSSRRQNRLVLCHPECRIGGRRSV